MKTGALIRFACDAGAVLGTGRRRKLAPVSNRYGAAIGQAFQIADDLLDVEGDSATLGKAAGKDAAAGKATLVAVLGVAGARARLDQLDHGGRGQRWRRSAPRHDTCAPPPASLPKGRARATDKQQWPQRSRHHRNPRRCCFAWRDCMARSSWRSSSAVGVAAFAIRSEIARRDARADRLGCRRGALPRPAPYPMVVHTDCRRHPQARRRSRTKAPSPFCC